MNPASMDLEDLGLLGQPQPAIRSPTGPGIPEVESAGTAAAAAASDALLATRLEPHSRKRKLSLQTKSVDEEDDAAQINAMETFKRKYARMIEITDAEMEQHEVKPDPSSSPSPPESKDTASSSAAHPPPEADPQATLIGYLGFIFVNPDKFGTRMAPADVPIKTIVSRFGQRLSSASDTRVIFEVIDDEKDQEHQKEPWKASQEFNQLSSIASAMRTLDQSLEPTVTAWYRMDADSTRPLDMQILAEAASGPEIQETVTVNDPGSSGTSPLTCTWWIESGKFRDLHRICANIPIIMIPIASRLWK